MAYTENRTTNANREGKMPHRQITLADGRYLIFYTFDTAYKPQAEADKGRKVEPDVEPDSTEEPPA